MSEETNYSQKSRAAARQTSSASRRTQNARVTVIVPVYNQLGFAVDAVGSVLRQTHENLQVVVVDDGSTDGTGDALAKHFGCKITLIQQRNAGPSAAVNAGIAVADGEFVALMGGDDLSTSNRISTQLAIMERTSHDIIFSKPWLIDAQGQPIAESAFPVLFRPWPTTPLLRSLLLEGNFLCAPTAFMRRDVIDKVGLFHPGLLQLQDYDYWLRAAAMGLSLAEFEPRVVHYRRHSANLSQHKPNIASVGENIQIMRSILESSSALEFRRAFKGMFEPAVNLNSVLTQFDKAMLLLTHPRQEVRMTALEYLLPLYKDKEFSEKARRVGLDLLRFTNNAL